MALLNLTNAKKAFGIVSSIFYLSTLLVLTQNCGEPLDERITKVSNNDSKVVIPECSSNIRPQNDSTKCCQIGNTDGPLSEHISYFWSYYR